MNEKRQPTYANIKMTELLELSAQDFKATIIKMLQQNLETNENLEYLRKEISYNKEWKLYIRKYSD